MRDKNQTSDGINDDQMDEDAAPDDYYVISSSYAYGGGCGYQASGLETFCCKQSALESQLDWLANSRRRFSQKEYEAEHDRLRRAVDEIEEKGDDEGVEVSGLYMPGDRVGYSIEAEGYWDEFVPDALSILAADASDDEGDDEEDNDDSRSELERIEDLQGRTDTHSSSFVEEFLELLDDYSSRHC